MIEFILLKLKNSIRIGINFMKKLQHHLMLIIGLFLATFLTGCFCTQKVEILPESLPNATLGTPYHAEIKILGGVVIDEFFTYHIKPENSGLELTYSHVEPYGSYNNIKVMGTPRIKETITIELFGNTYGTMCPGVEFDKTYTIKVEE